MRFSIVISAAPETEAARSAIRFCHAALNQQHEIYRLFFLAEGVRNSDSVSALYASWEELIHRGDLDAVCCATSAAKYQIAEKNNSSEPETKAPFHFSGLGQLVDAEVKSDRIITFG